MAPPATTKRDPQPRQTITQPGSQNCADDCARASPFLEQFFGRTGARLPVSKNKYLTRSPSQQAGTQTSAIPPAQFLDSTCQDTFIAHHDYQSLLPFHLTNT
jgi:hypothetical protein